MKQGLSGSEYLRNLTVYRSGGTLCARIIGPVNRESAHAFQDHLDFVIGEGRFALLIDLGNADFLDSDGVRWLQQLQSSALAAENEVRLAVRRGTRIDRALKLLQLDGAFPIDRYGPEPEPFPRHAREQSELETAGGRR
jgi:anti-anti-sigma regulatory factor